MTQKIQITLPADLCYSSLSRHITDEICGIVKFDKIWRGRLKLVVDELFMNAVKYGSTKDKSVIYITFIYDDNEIQFIIEDDGSGLKAISAEELKNIMQRNEANEDTTRTSGRGLSMITKLWTDKMDIEKSNYGGIKVSFVKKREISTYEIIENPTRKSANNNIDHNICEIKLADGEIDQSNINEKTAPVYNQIKVMSQGGVVVLDFNGVTYINSMFIANLASWHASMRRKDGYIKLKNIQSQVKEILDLVGLSKILTIDSQ